MLGRGLAQWKKGNVTLNINFENIFLFKARKLKDFVLTRLLFQPKLGGHRTRPKVTPRYLESEMIIACSFFDRSLKPLKQDEIEQEQYELKGKFY